MSRIKLDPESNIVKELFAVVYAPRRQRGRFPNDCVQVMDSRERIQGYLRSDVREVADGKQSAMPVFGPERLNENDLTDLLGYLATLKGFEPSVK